MKRISYKFMTEVNHGTEEQPEIQQLFNDVTIECKKEYFESNLAIAKREAYNGEYTVEDIPDPEHEPTAEERIAELEAINAALEDALCEMDAEKQAEIDELHETIAALEDAVCEMDVANAERIAAIEDALCEMDIG